MNRASAIACSILMGSAGLTWAQATATNQTLFVIERSKNANIVRYDAQLTAEGSLDSKQPVVAYWVLLAEDGRREALSKLERVKAYGFDVKPDPTQEAWVMTLAAYRKRLIVVRQSAQGPHAEMMIDGQPSIFERMYIHSTEGRVLPKVDYIELFGKDLVSGEKRYEKIVP